MDGDPGSGMSYASTSTSPRLPHNQSPDINAADPRSDSPANSTLLRTAATLEGLARQLEGLDDKTGGAEEVEEDTPWRCCCGNNALRGCTTAVDRDVLEDKLKLAGEIGQALLQRYEALEKRYKADKEKYKVQIDTKTRSLEASILRIHNLEKANTTHMSKFADMSRKNEALEKRYTQALHTQTLTQQSLTHVRAELTTLRKAHNRQSTALASGADVEERYSDMEKKYEEAREALEVESRKARDELRKRKRAEDRIADLENKLTAAVKEVEDVKLARSRDAQELLNNAKERLGILHSELSETFNGDSPSETPEYQTALETLVANNALLKHDATELSHLLAESRDQVRALKDEVDELRAAVGFAGRISPVARMPLGVELRDQAMQHPAHHRTESSPMMNNHMTHWHRMSVGGVGSITSVASGSTKMSAWEHHRRSSVAPSFTSSSTNDGGLTSPGLGIGSIGEFGGQILREAGTLSPPPDGRSSPIQPVFRTSPSGGIAYVLNGVPKRSNTVAVRPNASRRVSMDRRRMSQRTFSGVESIAEWSGSSDSQMQEHHATQAGSSDEPLSPSSEYFRAAEVSRKRRSLMLARFETASPIESDEFSPNETSTTLVNESTELPTPLSEISENVPPPGQTPAKKINRKTLLLLSKSKGVQTDPVEITIETSRPHLLRNNNNRSISMTSTGTETPRDLPDEQRSETSSIHDRSGLILNLVDHLSKVLTKLRQADIPTLNKRLRKHNLPGDVGHLSRSTMKSLQNDISELRTHWKNIPENNNINKKEYILLFKLLKDVFAELIDLQSIINDVTVDPKLAKRLKIEAFRDDDDLAASGVGVGTGGGGLGWIAAPITKFFVTPSSTEMESDAGGSSTARGRQSGSGQGQGQERGRLPVPGTVRVPKQVPTASATTTHVSVEFGGAGVAKRAKPAMTTAISSGTQTSAGAGGVMETIPGSPLPDGQTMSNRVVSNASTTGSIASSSKAEDQTDNLAAPATIRAPGGTLRPSRSRASRNELLGIFAGASGSRPHMPSSLHSSTITPGGLRSTSSQSLNNKPKSSKSGSGSRLVDDSTIRPSKERKRLSTIVDAVIDNTAENIDDQNDDSVDIPPPLLQRTLRPRGLSDSSIRSTFVSQGNDLAPTSSVSGIVDVGPSTRQGGYSGYGGYGGMLGAISRRWYGTTPGGAATSAVSTSSAASLASTAISGDTNSSGLTPPAAAQLSGSPSKPIPVSPSKVPQPIISTGIAISTSPSIKIQVPHPGTSSTTTTTTTTASSVPTQPSLLSYLASSLVGTATESMMTLVDHDGDGMLQGDYDHEGELLGVSMRHGHHGHGHGGMIPQRSRSRAPKWRE